MRRRGAAPKSARTLVGRIIPAMSADITTRGMLVALVTAWLIGLAAAGGQTPDGAPFRIERLHPALDDVVAADARLELLGDRFALTEGPVWVRDGDAGYLLFSDNAANVIYRWA